VSILKKQQRQQALARRDAMTPPQRAQASQRLVAYADAIEHFLKNEQLKNKTFSGFWPIRSEIDPRPLMFALAEGGKKLALPALIGKGRDRQMIFRAFKPDDELIAMGFDTFGPREEASRLDPDLILLPLAAFDKTGNRIGYGGGFYDRTLANMYQRGLRPKLVGLGFNCQEVDSIDAEPHDIRLEAILTESGLQLFDEGLR